MRSAKELAFAGNGRARVFVDEDAVLRAGADEIANRARLAVTRKGRFDIALSGGATPKGLFRRLATGAYDALPWGAVHLFWGDERAAAPSDPESNFGNAQELIARVPAGNAHRLRGEAKELAEAASDYERVLREHFGVRAGEVPRFDLALLGLGADGHTASLFPGTAALDERERLVCANAVPTLHTHRLTLTFPVFNAAVCVLFLVTGAAKASVLRRVCAGDDLPAARVRPSAGELWFFVDETAASRLAEARV